jgi:hypothetical protein
MKALLLMTMTALPTQADIVATCPFGINMGKPDCEDIEAAQQKLVSMPLSNDLRVVELQQYMDQLFLQTALQGEPTGDEGRQIEAEICRIPEWSELLDREYRMSVRMTYQKDGMSWLDEIVFIEDCEAD